MRYEIPNMSIEEILSFPQKLFSVVPDEEMILDISKMRKFDPLPMLLIGSTIRKYRLRYQEIPFHLTWDNDIGKSYAGTMGFFKYISEVLEIGKKPGEASGSSNYIPITPIDFCELLKAEPSKGNYLYLGDLIEKESGRLARVIDQGSLQLHELLTYLIREIMRNTPEHAETNKLWICGQCWPSYDLTEIAILDEGIGIYSSIKKNRVHRQYIKDNLSALEWSLKPGISNAFSPEKKQRSIDMWANSGFGLFMVSEICRYLGGSFCLISYDDYVLINDGEVKTGNTFFEGTAIQIKVPCGNIRNAQKIISTISSKGEKQSRSIRNAFKKASTPSKGLIEK